MPTLAYRLEQLTVDQDHRDGKDIVASRVAWERDTVAMSADQALAATWCRPGKLCKRPR
jgi:hypothetical protein